MFFSLKPLLFIFYFFNVHLKCIKNDSMTKDDENIWMLQNIIQMKSWNHGLYFNLYSRKIYYGEQSVKTLQAILDENSIVSSGNKDKVSSALYISLGCEFSDNLIKILKKAIEIHILLHEINKIVLKIISVMLDLIKIAPNVVSLEPGFLTTSLTLNMRINELFHFTAKEHLKKHDILSNDFVRRNIWYMINTIERFMTPNCPLDEDFENEMFLEKNSVNEPTRFIQTMNDLLDTTGLDTTSILEMKADNYQQNNNENYITIIVVVIKKLSPVLEINDSLHKSIEDIKNDFSDILQHMLLVYDSIMKIMYNKTLNTLESFQECQEEKDLDTLEELIRKWNEIGLINTYAKLHSLSIYKQFPMYFTNHIELSLRIIKDINYFRNIHDLKVLKKQIKEQLKVLKNKYSKKLKLFKINKKSADKDLWEILSEIISINEIKYFNLIFKLHQNYGPIEYDSIESELNKMEYNIIEENVDAQQQCEIIQSLYMNCFNIKITIPEYKKKPTLGLRLTGYFEKLLEETMNVCSSVSLTRANENFKVILQLLSRYLTGNKVNYMVEEIRLKKIIYFTMNLLDKYQIHNCKQLVHRSEIYAEYEKNPEIKSLNLGHLKIDEASGEENQTLCSVNPELNSYNNDVLQRTIAVLKQNDIGYDFDISHPTPFFYWRGELKNFNDISNDVLFYDTFDFSSYTKYVNMTHKWIVSVLFYTMIDFLKYLLRDRTHEQLFKNYVENLSTINFPEYFLPVINTINKAKSFNEPVDIIGYQILLQNHVKQYSIIHEFNFSVDITAYKKRLNFLNAKLMEKYNGIYTQSEIISPPLDEKLERVKSDIINENIIDSSKSTKTSIKDKTINAGRKFWSCIKNKC